MSEQHIAAWDSRATVSFVRSILVTSAIKYAVSMQPQDVVQTLIGLFKLKLGLWGAFAPLTNRIADFAPITNAWEISQTPTGFSNLQLGLAYESLITRLVHIAPTMSAVHVASTLLAFPKLQHWLGKARAPLM